MLENSTSDRSGSNVDRHLSLEVGGGAYDFVRLGKQAAMVSLLATAYFLIAAVSAHI